MKGLIEKHRSILDFALSSLLRRKAKVFALVTLYTLIIFILGSVLLYASAIRREAGLVLHNSPDIVVQRLIAGRHDLISQKYVSVLSKIRGVASSRLRFWGYYYHPISGANYTILAPHDDPPAAGTVVIGNGVSRSLLVRSGDMLPLRTSRGDIILFSVAGILPAESEMVSSDLIVMSEQDIRNLFGFPAGYGTDIVLVVPNEKERVTVAQKAAQLLPDVRPILKEEILRTYDAIFSWRSSLVMVLIAGAFLAFMIFAWDRSLDLSAEEKREIGILKAIGWETSDVLVMEFWKGAVISLFSFLSGILLAYVHVFFFSAVLFGPILRGWSVLYPAFPLTPFIDGTEMATLFFLAVVPYSVVVIIPTWRAATVDPDSVMR